MTKLTITGIGGVLIRAKAPTALAKWYDDHLGLTQLDPTTHEPWHQAAGPTVFQPFAQDSDYFPAHQQVMFNFRVDDLDALLAQLEAAGVKIDDNRMNEDYGKFAWIYDPEGNKIELWQPLD